MRMRRFGFLTFLMAVILLVAASAFTPSATASASCSTNRCGCQFDWGYVDCPECECEEGDMGVALANAIADCGSSSNVSYYCGTGIWGCKDGK